jgi:lysophospholipase L1-like esterase
MIKTNWPGASLGLALLLASACLPAQQPGTSAPAAAQNAAPPAASQPAPANTYQQETAHMLQVDFGQLQFYQAADAQLPPPAPGQNRVVFMGDSITHGWDLGQSFPGKPYVNRGISGQTTPQMLVRFRQDVINLHPKVVVILAGTNDIAGNTGPMTPQETKNNIESMSDLATANHIRVVLCSIPPSINFWWAPGKNPGPKIVILNAWIKGYAAQKHFPYVDFYSKMADTEGGLPKNLSRDGVHPNPAAYDIMAPLAEAGIQQALHSPE